MRVENQEPKSLTGSQGEEVPDQENPQGADSPPAQQADDQDLLSVAKAVLETPDPAASSPAEPASDDEPEITTDPTQSEQSQQSTDDENYSDVSFRNHPRFRQLIRQRNDLRKEVDTLNDDATRYRNVETFLTNNGLDANEAAELLLIGGLMKRNPLEAWNRALPTIQQLALASGAVLPTDLSDRVQRGEISRETASEISRLRAQDGAMRADSRFQAEQYQRQSSETNARLVQGTVESWEKQKRSSDPDFDALKDSLETEVAARLYRLGKTPASAKEAATLLEDAYNAVKQQRRELQSYRKPAKSSVTGGKIAGNSRPEPQSLREAMMRAVEPGK